MFFLEDDAVDAGGSTTSGRPAGAGNTRRKGRDLEMFASSGIMKFL
jgi:hypothetical protein